MQVELVDTPGGIFLIKININNDKNHLAFGPIKRGEAFFFR
jgi:hypothetical protein